MNKKIIRLYFFMMLATLLTSCGPHIETQTQSTFQEEETMNEIQTDIDILKNYFPNLSGIESATYKAEPLGTNTEGSVPGPSAYRVYGYIKLNEETSKEFEDSYVWQEISPDYIEIDGIDYHSLSWQYSKDWEKAVKPGYFLGHFYYSNGVIMFDCVRS